MRERLGRLLASPWFYVATIVVVAAATIGVMALGQNIVERKAEGERAYFAIEELDEDSIDPAIWGRNFPRQYDGYRRTVDTERTRYGGSEAFSKLDADPRLLTIFDGYAFAIQYDEERGHAYSLEDQRTTRRVTEKEQPGACLHCHGSVLKAYYEAGVEAGARPAEGASLRDPVRQAAVQKGFEAVNPMPYLEATKLVEHPVACIDCHDPETMDLRVTRPAFLAGIRRLAESKAALPHLPSITRWREETATSPTTRTRRPRGRRCAPSSAVSVTWSTTSRAKRSCSRTRGTTASAARTSSATTTPWGGRTGSTPRAVPGCSRRSIRNSRRGTRACTRGRRSPVPIATCRTYVRAR